MRPNRACRPRTFGTLQWSRPGRYSWSRRPYTRHHGPGPRR
jgi:hypothetical protein